MDARSRAALLLIRRCVAAGQYRLLRHVTDRMDQRGLFWPDLLAVLDHPQEFRSGGRDKFNRPKWITEGIAADGLRAGLVCAIDVDEYGEVAVFITMY